MAATKRSLTIIRQQKGSKEFYFYVHLFLKEPVNFELRLAILNFFSFSATLVRKF